MKQLLSAYGKDNYATRETVGQIHRVYPEVLICIAYADSSLGRFLKTDNNFGNAGNNDRGDTKSFVNPAQGIDAIASVGLESTYLRSRQSVMELSPYGGKPGPYYATSPENWGVNVLNCLGMVYDKKVDDFPIRR